MRLNKNHLAVSGGQRNAFMYLESSSDSQTDQFSIDWRLHDVR